MRAVMLGTRVDALSGSRGARRNSKAPRDAWSLWKYRAAIIRAETARQRMSEWTAQQHKGERRATAPRAAGDG